MLKRKNSLPNAEKFVKIPHKISFEASERRPDGKSVHFPAVLYEAGDICRFRVCEDGRGSIRWIGMVPESRMAVRRLQYPQYGLIYFLSSLC